MEVDTKIIEKYDRPGPRYTSYPPANLFKAGFRENQYVEALKRSNTEGQPGISLYVHVPFCPRLCHFCGCNTRAGDDPVFINRYFEAVLEEIDRVAACIDRERPVRQVHWGGGTPNSVDLELVEGVMDRFRDRFRFSEDAEIAIECSPAYLDPEDIDALAGMGFNRISIGIQDFDESVLNLINRTPSRLPVEVLAEHIREHTRAGINFDFVYGLPGQTLEGYLESLEKAAAIGPDRLVTFSYAHVPWVKPNQKILEKRGIPGPEQKLEMLFGGYDYLTRSGYIPIGMDHFALPGDEMAVAFRQNTLHRNFQGYCTRKHTGQVYAFGASSISQLHGSYIQNVKDAGTYVERLESGRLAVEKGYTLNDREKLIREVINQLMCNGRLELQPLAGQLGMETFALKELLNYSPGRFREMEADGLLTADEHRIEATPLGMLLIRVIARELDPNYETYRKMFSKTI